MDRMLAIVVKLAAAVDELDAAFESDLRPWSADVGSFADNAVEDATRALDAAIFAAIGSGVSIAEIEAAISRPVVKPDWFQ